jgi:hypothetical protein
LTIWDWKISHPEVPFVPICTHLVLDTNVLYHPLLGFGSGDRPNLSQPGFIKRAKVSAIAVQTHSRKDLKKFEEM